MTEHNFYCLFNTGDFATVTVEKHETDPSEPVQGFFVLDGGRGFSLAAKRAAVRVYSVLKNQGMSVSKYSAMFDLLMDSTQDLMSVSGQSGGLAFALALASEIMGKGCGPVAATGIIEADGSIGKVLQADLDAKIEAACRALSKGGVLICPQDNQISDESREVLKGKGIELIRVAAVAQALHVSGIINTPDVLEIPGVPVKPAERRYLTALFVVLLLLLILAVGLLFLNESSGTRIGSLTSDLKMNGDRKQPLSEIQPVSSSAPEKETVLNQGFE